MDSLFTNSMTLIPSLPYAIRSHTWTTDEEMIFGELRDGMGRGNEEHKKIEFCEKQAQQDGLEYVWVDTCCIDKANKVKLSHAINSMFRWYRNAARCYVYMSDVSCACTNADRDPDSMLWELDF